jgi:hypothetical protein
MTPKVRKCALTLHVTFSVGWLGAVLAYLALVVAALNSKDSKIGYVAWISMDLIGWYVIVPLALASLITGIIMSLVTQWGVLRHYWVIFKLVLTVFATVILLQTMPGVSVQADLVSETSSFNIGGLQSQLLHAGGGLVVLGVITVLSVFKPKGLTKYGQRKQREQRLGSQ